MIYCPSCREDDIREVSTGCIDPEGEDGDTLTFLVCGLCDHGINYHTEGMCDCAKVAPQ